MIQSGPKDFHIGQALLFVQLSDALDSIVYLWIFVVQPFDVVPNGLCVHHMFPFSRC